MWSCLESTIKKLTIKESLRNQINHLGSYHLSRTF